MSKDIVRKPVPVDFLDLDGMELWLEEMAAKGLHFQGSGVLFAHFLPGAPAQVRCHAEPTPDKRRDVIPGQAVDCGDLGWSYAGKSAGWPSSEPATPAPQTSTLTRWPRATLWSG